MICDWPIQIQFDLTPFMVSVHFYYLSLLKSTSFKPPPKKKYVTSMENMDYSATICNNEDNTKEKMHDVLTLGCKINLCAFVSRKKTSLHLTNTHIL